MQLFRIPKIHRKINVPICIISIQNCHMSVNRLYAPVLPRAYHQIPDIGDKPEGLPYDKHRIMTDNSVTDDDQRSYQRKYPEKRRQL